MNIACLRSNAGSAVRPDETVCPQTIAVVQNRLENPLVALSALYLVLLIPERKPPAPVGAGRRPFSWNRDAFW